MAAHTPRGTSRSMSGTAPGASGASVTSTMRPPAASWRRSKSSTLASRTCSRGCAPRGPSSGEMYRTLHVNAGDGLVRHTSDDARARREKSSRDDVMTVGSTRVTPTERVRSSAELGFRRWRIWVELKFDAAKPVHLKKSKNPGNSIAHGHSSSRTTPRVAGDRRSADKRSRYTVVSECRCRIDAGAIGETSPSRHA